MFYFAECTARIKYQHVRSGKQNKEDFVPEDRVMNVLEWIAGKEQRSSAETNRKTGDSKRQQLVQRREWKSFRHPKQPQIHQPDHTNEHGQPDEVQRL